MPALGVAAFTDGPIARGAVMLNDWIKIPPGDQVMAIIGRLELVTKESLGVSEVGSRDSTWALAVSGAQSTMLVLGCQIRAVLTLPAAQPGEHLSRDYWQVP
jgi:hypothetical protein